MIIEFLKGRANNMTSINSKHIYYFNIKNSCMVKTI